VVGWLDLGYAHPNTGGNTGNANRRIARDAIRKADSYVDFKAFDLNGDGYVDSSELAVVVIVAGFERSYGAGYEPCVWGHKWDMGGSFQPPIVDEVIVGADHDGAGGYAQFGEIHQSTPDDRHHATIGIMVHELGHLIFGLPDLYDTDDSSSGVGAFCVMGGGSWGQKTTDAYEGQTPVLPCAWIKYNRGWVSAPSVIEGTERLPAAGAIRTTGANSAIKRPTCTSNEFFLIENREPLGYDRGLEKYLGTGFGGIAIWHVDESVPNNRNDSHRMVDLEEADGTEMGESRGEKTDLWYAGNETIFNRLSDPSSITYSGIPSEATIITKTRAKLVMKVTFRTSRPRRTLAIKESSQGALPHHWVSEAGEWLHSPNAFGGDDYYTFTPVHSPPRHMKSPSPTSHIESR
jgi:M6 family metalloprotease-like protein